MAKGSKSGSKSGGNTRTIKANAGKPAKGREAMGFGSALSNFLTDVSNAKAGKKPTKEAKDRKYGEAAKADLGLAGRRANGIPAGTVLATQSKQNPKREAGSGLIGNTVRGKPAPATPAPSVRPTGLGNQTPTRVGSSNTAVGVGMNVNNPNKNRADPNNHVDVYQTAKAKMKGGSSGKGGKTGKGTGGLSKGMIGGLIGR